MKLASCNVIVTGSQGAWIDYVAGLLSIRGWQILWPGQDIDIYAGQYYLDHNKQNIEVQNIHTALCHQCGLSSPLDLSLPRFYDAPYPGPKEFISKFDGPAVISGTCMMSFLDIWAEVAEVVIDIRATEQEDLEAIMSWTDNAFSIEHVKDIRNVHLARYDEHLRLFPQVFTMTNAEVKDNRLDKLIRFLNSTF